ncbi:hypothetical protein CMI42_04360 [Candidatus Pacearchaeota archaeon]|nr:hypothetical protein [Candidatus Pacearchaeota archaeon]
MIISILMINKVSKSSNSLKLKIYYCIIICFVLFFAIVFFWFLGDRYPMDEKGLGSFSIIYASIIFGLISFVVGLILSIKRRHRKDFNYNLKPFLIIVSLISLILLLIALYNPLIHNIAVLKHDENICNSIITTSYNYIFDPSIHSKCISQLGILDNDESICELVCQRHENYIGHDEKNDYRSKYIHIDYRQGRYDLCERSLESNCYLEIAKKKIDINLCDKTYRPERCYSAINTLCTKRNLPVETCGMASEGGEYSMDFEP